MFSPQTFRGRLLSPLAASCKPVQCRGKSAPKCLLRNCASLAGAAMGAQTSHSPLPDLCIPWYRTPLDPKVSHQLHQLSDLQASTAALLPCSHPLSHVAAASSLNHLLQGFLQTIPWLAALAASASLSLFFASASDRFSPAAALFACLYCTQSNFLINAMHELGHGHVFKTKVLNSFFMRIVSFLGWLHPDMFFSSHLRHHRFTQNPPLDLENPAPIRIMMLDFLSFGFLNVKVLQNCRQGRASE